MSRRVTLALDRPRILGILNVTPDSFSDGGKHDSPAAALAAAERMIAEGADALDIGGESTRPGATPVPAAEQIARVVPVIRLIRARVGAVGAAPLSVDTTSAVVARAALDAGADAINDISAGRDDPGMLALAAAYGAGVILMHRLTPPSRDSYSDAYRSPPAYDDIIGEVAAFLAGRARAARAAGVAHEAIAIDPGLGFGKTVEQNISLIVCTNELADLGYPVVSALSRKSFVGRMSHGRETTPDERLPGTLALSGTHYRAGARLFRVHDAAAHVEALRGV